ncbi:MAG: translation elongation factor Ts [Patescibacteria group bacterium]|nr:translation elongation factor Ts [Patescibacteria group bacterium]
MKKSAKIAAAEIKKLREKTGASVMECRNALSESGGNIEKALEYLKKRGNEKALKKAERKTSEGVVATYIHSNKKIGAMVELLCETDFVARNVEFQELARDLAMHIAAMNPKYESVEKVPQIDREEYEEIARAEIASEKKPAEIVKKIIAGKTKKYFSDISLMSQAFVKNPQISVGNLIKEKIAKIGENIQLGNFARFSI